ncbi:sensor domain-containing diguanylate cyclase, partial [Gilvimarinus sp. SDUM040013]|uniref:sensor domain-containing diguanylate cyclase n=1 Tax=Gilvimarinus gilvus TaxID=3058038 RepID=UPI0026738E2E
PVNYQLLAHHIRFHIKSHDEKSELQAQKTQLSIAQRVAMLMTWQWDTESGIFRLSEELQEFFHRESEETDLSFEEYLQLIHPEDRLLVKSALYAARYKHKRESLEYRIQVNKGHYRVVHQELNRLNKQHLVLGTLQDITLRRADEQKIRELAYKDKLTGLASRAYFMNYLENAIHSATRDGSSLAVFYMDLDGFKDVNDSLGHDVGDQLLITVSERLRKPLRASDFVARLGGDEFCMLITDDPAEKHSVPT